MEEVIFFLKLENNLPQWYFQFAFYFSQYQMKVVPINLEELWDHIEKPQLRPLVIPIVNLVSKRNFTTKTQDLLEKSMKNSKISLFHLSSFQESFLTKKWRRYSNYAFFELPRPINELAETIATSVQNYRRDRIHSPYNSKIKMSSDTL